MRPVERAFIGDADASEAIYRLLKAAREGKRLREEVRIAGLKGRPARWLRFRVRPLGRAAATRRLTRVVARRHHRASATGKKMSFRCCSTRSTISIMRRPASSRSIRRRHRLSQRHARQLARSGSRAGRLRWLKLADLVAGDGAALLTTLRGAPGEVKDRSARSRPAAPAPATFCRCGCSTSSPSAQRRHCPARRARWCSTAPATTAPIRSAPPKSASCGSSTIRRWRSRPSTARRRGAHQPAVRKLFHVAARRARREDRSIARRRRRTRPRGAAGCHRAGRARQGRHRAGRRHARRRRRTVRTLLTSPRSKRRSATRRRPSSTRWKPRRSGNSRTRSPSSRRWSWSASSPAASPTISTTCCPPS